MDYNLRQILQKHGFTFKKAFGQNFLTDTALLEDIVIKSGVTKDDVVLEIGPGAGALTRVLSDRAKHVVCYEIDTKLKPILEDVLYGRDNVEVIFKDVLKEKMSDLEKKLGGKYLVVANLPYYITTPIVMNFLENAKNMKAMVIMVQEEVALRFSAKAGSSDYGAITVGINLKGNAEVVKTVGREMFTPMPNVDSAVVKITVDNDKFKGVDFDGVRNAVRIGFSSRRKMLVNNLMNSLKLSRSDAEEILNSAGIDLKSRGETLSVEDYIRLSKQIKKHG